MSMFDISYSLIKFEIKFDKDIKLNKNKESALKGILGNALMDIYCIKEQNERECNNCYFNNKCIAANIKNTKLKSSLSFIADDSTTPIIVECNDYKEQFTSEDTLVFRLKIFGDTIINIPIIINAYSYAGFAFGLSGNLFKVIAVSNEQDGIIFDGESLNKCNIKITSLKEYIDKRSVNLTSNMKFITQRQIRLKVNGKLSEDLTESTIEDMLLRRILILNALEGNIVNKSDNSFDILLSSKNLRWSEYKRYSNRQKSDMLLGGITGSVNITAYNDFSKKLLIAGELIHIGKNPSFGLGKYKLTNVNE